MNAQSDTELAELVSRLCVLMHARHAGDCAILRIEARNAAGRPLELHDHYINPAPASAAPAASPSAAS